jgi:hypothetical protein
MSKMPVYGFPCVENPHDFDPDVECCSPQEIETWRRAKANWGKPGFEPNKGCETTFDEAGNLVKHVLRTSWGIGVNLIDQCDGCQEVMPGSLMTCHECGGSEYCEVCWPKHEAEHEEQG